MPPSRPAPGPSPSHHARLVTGSTMQHVVGMTFAGSIGLVAIFFVDFLSLFYISLLKDERLTAGVGYATTVLFFAIAVNIGLLIASSALVARKLGAGDVDEARRLAGSGAVLATVTASAVAALMLAFLPQILTLLGAEGPARAVASRFLWITLPANVLMAFGMLLSGTLRALGDARRAMMVTLIGGIATAGFDPLFIFGFGMGTDGAAFATVLSRVVFCIVGWQGVVRHHGMMAVPRIVDLKRHAAPLIGIAVPAVLTNIAGPVAGGFVLSVARQFGDAAVAATTIIDRLVPLSFCVIFALSGSIGPILAQNLGAGRHDRVRQTMKDGALFSTGYCLIVWAVLALSHRSVAAMFGASAETAGYIGFFCTIGAAAWVFNSLMFVANAAFNNLGFPIYSTLFNWGRATLGTMPFALAGAHYAGYRGVMVALIGGWALFGLASLIMAFVAIGQLERKSAGAKAG